MGAFGYFPSVRAALLFAFAALTALASADRVITIPTGRKIPFKAVRAELWYQPTKDGTTEYYFGTGLTDLFEIEVRTQRLPQRDVNTAVDLSYNIIGPIPDLTPGISIGVQDVANATLDGRRPYAALTLRQTLSALDGDANGDVTLGVYAGERGGAFIGVSLPITTRIRLLGEHNRYRPSGGIEYTPQKGLALRYFARGAQPFVSISLTRRF